MSDKALFDIVRDIVRQGLTQAGVNRIMAGAAKSQMSLRSPAFQRRGCWRR